MIWLSAKIKTTGSIKAVMDHSVTADACAMEWSIAPSLDFNSPDL